MLERFGLKNDADCTSQRLKRTSGARVMIVSCLALIGNCIVLYCIIALLYSCIIGLLYYCTTVLLYCIGWYYCIIILLYYRIIVLYCMIVFYYCITVSVY